MPQNINSKLIVKNTIVLYVRMLFTLALSLFTTRELLRILGVNDFGLYNVVGGIVLIFGFLNNAMIASSQRFISFALGKGDINQQKRVFSTSVFIHLIIATIILLLAETIGLWFMNSYMTIPEDRYSAVNWVYQASILTFILQICQVPYSASVIAHEHMSFYAFVSILDAILKLIFVYLLTLFNADKLQIYGVLMLTISLIDLCLYVLYASICFKECRISMQIERSLFKDMLSFAGWSFIGNFGFAVKDYGVNILLNMFCGPAINAARGLAYQIMNAMNGFVMSFQTAMNPQITKRYAIGEIESTVALVKNGSRYSFYLLSIIVIPLFIRAEYILELWLKDVPDMTLQFMRLSLVMALINSMFGPLVTAMQATGKIKVFQIAIATIMITDLPISFFLLKYNLSPYYVMYAAIFTAFLGLVVRAILLNRLIKIDLKDFIINIIIKNLVLGFIIFTLVKIVSLYIPQTFCGLIVFCCFSLIISLIVYYLFSSYQEKRLLACYIYQKIRK